MLSGGSFLMPNQKMNILLRFGSWFKHIREDLSLYLAKISFSASTLLYLTNILLVSAYFLPNLGGTLPNDAFNHILGLPTVWIPHSYGGCSQHAPNEHLLAPVVRESLRLMTGLFWDLGENPPGGVYSE